MKKAKKIVGIIMIVTFIAAMIYMFYGISVLLNPNTFTSFPWTWACFLTAIYFGPILAVELIVYIVLWIKERRKHGTQKK